MMSSSVIFTYKRRRFSSKPQIVDELQSDPSSKSPIGDACKIEVSVNESELQIEPQKMDKLQLEPPIGDCSKEAKHPQIESEKIEELISEDSYGNSQIEPQKMDKLQSGPSDEPLIGESLNGLDDSKPEMKDDLQPFVLGSCDESNLQIGPQKRDEMQFGPQKMDESETKDVTSGENGANGILINPNSNEQENTVIIPQSDLNKDVPIVPVPIKEILPNYNKYKYVYKSKSKSPEKKRTEIDLTKPAEIEMKILPEKEKEIETEAKNFPEKEKETEVETEIIPELEGKIEIETEAKNFPEKERETEIETVAKNFPEKETETEIETEAENFPEMEMEMEKETETEAKKFPERERETELEWLNSLDRDLKEKNKKFEGSNVNLDKSPFCADLLSLRPNYNQEISSGLTSQTKSKSPSPSCTNLFGVSIETLNAQNLKGKSVNSSTTHDFLTGPSWAKTHQSQAASSATPQFDEKLKLNNNNYYYGLTNSDWSEGELDFLWIGVRRYGTNNWYGILNDPIFYFWKKSPADLAKQWEIEQRKLFSVPVRNRYGTDISLGEMNAHNNNNYNDISWYGTDISLGEMNVHNNNNYNDISARYLHNSHDYYANNGLYPSYNCSNYRRAKYQTRRAPTVQKLNATPSPATNKNNITVNNSINISSNGNNNNELPHWLKEMIEPPAGPKSGLKRKLTGDEPNRNELFNLNEKKPVPNYLVVIDSDDDVAGSEETISE